VYDKNCSVSFYQEWNAENDPIIAYIKKNGKVRNGNHSVDIPSLCEALSVSPFKLNSHLNLLYY